MTQIISCIRNLYDIGHLIFNMMGISGWIGIGIELHLKGSDFLIVFQNPSLFSFEPYL